MPIQLLPDETANHCRDPLAWPGIDAIAPMGIESLPYHGLGARGLERLCFQLIVCDGEVPRFFGETGQAQLGIDLIMESGNERTVYQCKNLGKPPTVKSIAEVVSRFTEKWLGEASLPKPARFVYCCPQTFDDSKENQEFVGLQDDFKRSTGIGLVIWHRRYFDERLRLLPDLVANAFSDDYASVFCKQENWRYDLFTEVRTSGIARHRAIQRFLDLRKRQCIAVSSEIDDKFHEAASRSRITLVRGVPGSGKTITTLDLVTRLADKFTGLRHRVYYGQLSDNPNLENLVRAMQFRRSLPSIFVLDDCHVDFEVASKVVERLAPELASTEPKIAIFLLARHVPKIEDDSGDAPDFVEKLSSFGAVINLTTDKNRIREVLELVRPDLRGLSKDRVETIHSLTGGDLFLLGELLDLVEEPKDVDKLDLRSVLKHTRLAYFSRNTVYYPNILRIAAAFQFGVAPDVRCLPGPSGDDEKEVAQSLLGKQGSPPRHHFLHSSLSELLFRALLDAEGIVDQEHVERRVVGELLQYFQKLDQLVKSGETAEQNLRTDAEQIVRGCLNLTHVDAQLRLKANFLNGIIGIFERHLESVTPRFLFSCLWVLRNSGASDTTEWSVLAARRLEQILLNSTEKSISSSLVRIASVMGELQISNPELLRAIQKKAGAERFLQIIRSSGTLVEFFKVLANVTPDFSWKILDALSESGIDELCNQTITTGRSIGTLNLVLRKLGKVETNLLSALEEKIGAERFLGVIRSNGTLFELFMTLKHSTPGFSQKILDALDEPAIDDLCKQTIATGRSIGTLHLALQELGEGEGTRLCALQEKIGAERFLGVIRSNGTLFELFKLLENARFGFSQKILDALDEPAIDDLCKQTIATGRSIGTLSLTLRQLGRDEGDLLATLQEKIGAKRFLRVVRSNGTLFELLLTLEYSTFEFAQELLDVLDASVVSHLVERTIEIGRSIAAFHFVIGWLGRKMPRKLAKLEALVSVEGWWRMILANGKLSDIVNLANSFTDSFRRIFLDQAEQCGLDQWKQILMSSGFYGASCFLEAVPTLPEKSRTDFNDVLREHSLELVKTSDFYSLNTGRKLLLSKQALPGVPTLQSALESWLRSISLESLAGAGLRDASNGLELIWWGCPDLRPDIARDLWAALPPERLWPAGAEELALFRLVFNIARSSKVPRSHALQFLWHGRAFQSQSFYDNMESLPLFLYLWNLAALWFERVPEPENRFEKLIPLNKRRVLVANIKKRAEDRIPDSDRIPLLSLAGIVNLLVPESGKEISVAFEGRIREIGSVREAAALETFVPAFFALSGLSLLSSRRDNFSAELCAKLLAAAELYEQSGPSIEFLKRRVKESSKRTL
jgi:hypothetical protein